MADDEAGTRWAGKKKIGELLGPAERRLDVPPSTNEGIAHRQDPRSTPRAYVHAKNSTIHKRQPGASSGP